MTFALEIPTAAKLHHVNVRAEMAGKESTPAIDLKISFDAANDVLSMFDPWLLSAIYHKADAQPTDGAQQTLEGVEHVSDVPNLRMPWLAMPVRWSKEYSGYTLALDYGLGGKSNIELVSCDVNQIAFEAKEGGTVTTTMRVQCSKGLTEKVLGKLATLVQHDVQILLDPPEQSAQEDIEPKSGPWPFGDKGEKNAPNVGKTPEEALAETQP